LHANAGCLIFFTQYMVFINEQRVLWYNTGMSEEIVTADKTYRTRLFGIYILCVAAGTLAIVFGVPRLISYIQRLNFMEAQHTIEIVLICLLCSFFPAAVYLIITGRNVLKHGAFPYPGMKVIRDTIVVSGDKARLRGKALIFLGSLFIVLMLAGIAIIHSSFVGFLEIFS
jgi:hypothetical protein